MIQISVEPGAAFDILSILEIKWVVAQEVGKKFQLQEQITLLQSEINLAIGYDKAIKIYKSDQYKALYRANLSIFDQIAKEKSEADILNYQRFLAKSELQKEFFGESLKEIKIGY